MSYVLRRIGYSIRLLLAVSVFSFAFLELAPGEFFDEMKMNPQISPETIGALRERYGLTASPVVRYLHWLQSAAQGDFGYSPSRGGSAISPSTPFSQSARWSRVSCRWCCVFAVRAALPLHINPRDTFLLLVIVIGVIGWARPARLVRGIVLSAREQKFVLAGRGFGASNAYLLRRHVLPQAYGVLLAQAGILIPQYILAEVTLSFLGLGVGEPAPSWATCSPTFSAITCSRRTGGCSRRHSR